MVPVTRCVRRAYVRRAYVRRAYVRRAYVRRAYVRRAYVRRAYVRRAYVRRAYVRRALEAVRLGTHSSPEASSRLKLFEHGLDRGRVPRRVVFLRAQSQPKR